MALKPSLLMRIGAHLVLGYGCSKAIALRSMRMSAATCTQVSACFECHRQAQMSA
jgi:hypothetical protein